MSIMAPPSPSVVSSLADSLSRIKKPRKIASIGALNSSRSRTIENLAAQILKKHPHFRYRSPKVEFRCCENRLLLSGCLPSFFLKQMAQEAVRRFANSERLDIDNEVTVSPVGTVRGNMELT